MAVAATALCPLARKILGTWDGPNGPRKLARARPEIMLQLVLSTALWPSLLTAGDPHNDPRMSGCRRMRRRRRRRRREVSMQNQPWPRICLLSLSLFPCSGTEERREVAPHISASSQTPRYAPSRLPAGLSLPAACRVPSPAFITRNEALGSLFLLGSCQLEPQMGHLANLWCTGAPACGPALVRCFKSSQELTLGKSFTGGACFPTGKASRATTQGDPTAATRDQRLNRP